MLRTQPETRTISTMIQAGLAALSSATEAVTAPERTAPPTRARRNPVRRSSVRDKVRTDIAPNVDEKVSSPASVAL